MEELNDAAVLDDLAHQLLVLLLILFLLDCGRLLCTQVAACEEDGKSI